jgi:hypothetical protein
MERFFLLIVPIAAQLVLLYAASVYLNRRLYKRLGLVGYLFFMWPGVIVHELSHLAACLITFTRIREVRVFEPRVEPSGDLLLGYVRHDEPRNPFAAMLIGAAPFFGGSAALYLVFRVFIGRFDAASLAVALPSQGAASVVAALAGAVASYAGFLYALASRLDWHSWATYVFLYLAAAVSSHAAPSRTDLKQTFIGLAEIIALAGIAVFILYLAGIAVPEAGAAWLARPALAVSGLLGCGLAGTGLFVIVVFLLETIPFLARRAWQW